MCMLYSVDTQPQVLRLTLLSLALLSPGLVLRDLS